jgi:hypothetical protein
MPCEMGRPTIAAVNEPDLHYARVMVKIYYTERTGREEKRINQVGPL